MDGRRPARTAVALVLLPVLLAASAGAVVACARPETGPGGDPGAGRAEGVEAAADGGRSGVSGVPVGSADRADQVARAARPRALVVRVLDERPHASDAFTQGLLLHGGYLYESTGQYGRSTLRKVDPETGQVLERRELPRTLFAEGLALVPGPSGDRLIQLTWRSGVALVWDLESLEQVGEHRYAGEGWGLTFDGERLIMSDGSSTLTFRDPASFDELGRVQVTLGGRPLGQLNELEWVDGRVWANVWGSTTVVEIDPESGRVTATAELGDLLARLDPRESLRIDVLNGIAYRAYLPGEGGGGSFLVTGKLWPRLFEVALEPSAP